MAVKTVFFVLALAVLSPFLYQRGQFALSFYTNAPSRLVKINAFRSHSIKFADRVRSCEDVLLLEDRGLAILACDPGRERWNTVLGIFHPGPVTSAGLYAYEYKDAGTPDAEALKSIELANFPAGQDFHTLGMAYDKATSTLLVCNHAQAGSRLEMFKLDIAALTASHIRTIVHPLVHAPNAIALINSNEFYVTNDHLFPVRRSNILSKMETYLATPTGTIVHVELRGDAVQANVVARLAFANGIEILNSTTVAVSSTNQGVVYLYTKSSDATLKYRSQFPVPFMPDNLSLSAGKLLIAGHPHLPTLLQFSRTRHICNDPAELAKATAEMKEYCSNAEATSWVSEWSETGGLRHLYAGTEYPTSATAARDAKRGVGIVAGLYAKGIMVWRE
ncbi:Serum paraoxonase/arylesterase 1 [Tolypocladium ophioglossoides CBS 100239]|uniref:Serum paraoxonase/arylesterase 1 n=1 Tax=Tolypocladium ophioglossoides (strain CBS 100239) TaxID=1163406 RepID=A0A0L0NH80_TOLOC|nr:Serum paraoxonase/arylesterase 1 [Tolypocladium ophioglossoides CBS 100239]